MRLVLKNNIGKNTRLYKKILSISKLQKKNGKHKIGRYKYLIMLENIASVITLIVNKL